MDLLLRFVYISQLFLGPFVYCAYCVFFLSIAGNELIFMHLFMRNVMCAYISLHPCFKVPADMLDCPGGLF